MLIGLFQISSQTTKGDLRHWIKSHCYEKSRYLTRGALKWISKNNSMRTILAMSNRIYCRLMRFVAEERWFCCNRYMHDSEIIFKSSPLSTGEWHWCKNNDCSNLGKAEFWGIINIILATITILSFVLVCSETNIWQKTIPQA